VPDAAIMVMTLPDGTGTQICRALRQWSSIPVILLSGVSDEIWLLEAFDAGAMITSRTIQAPVAHDSDSARSLPDHPAALSERALGG
jgi:CheY-like chemotaxis protein